MSSPFQKGGHSATLTEQTIISTYIGRNVTELTPKQGAEYEYRTTTLGRSVLNDWGLKPIYRCQPRPQSLEWLKTFSWLFGSHDNLPNCQLNSDSKQMNHERNYDKAKTNYPRYLRDGFDFDIYEGVRYVMTQHSRLNPQTRLNIILYTIQRTRA